MASASAVSWFELVCRLMSCVKAWHGFGSALVLSSRGFMSWRATGRGTGQLLGCKGGIVSFSWPSDADVWSRVGMLGMLGL